MKMHAIRVLVSIVWITSVRCGSSSQMVSYDGFPYARVKFTTSVVVKNREVTILNHSIAWKSPDRVTTFHDCLVTSVTEWTCEVKERGASVSAKGGKYTETLNSTKGSPMTVVYRMKGPGDNVIEKEDAR